jgi:uncharacterized membrane protein YedE/YeeE
MFAYFVFNNYTRSSALDHLISFTLGLIFGLGLLISGMCRISKILGFLELSSRWDPSLMFVMASAVGINLISFHFIMKNPSNPVYANRFNIPVATRVDAQLIGGAVIFGLGWGLSALCPGPGMINFFVFTNVIFWIIGLAAG